MNFSRCKFQLFIISLVALTSWMPPNSSMGQENFRGPGDIDGSRLTGEQKKDDSLIPKKDNGADATARRLLRELDNLVPGDLEKDSEEEKLLLDIIADFQKGNAESVLKKVEEIAKRPDYPPSDVMLAALSFSSNDQKTGILLLERASSKFPDHPSIYSAFARLAINSGRTTDARVLFEKLSSVVAATKLSDEAKKFYTAQYLDGMIDIAIGQKRFADARTMLAEQKTLLPDHPKVMMVSAEIEFKENNVEKCIEFLTQMKKKYPQSRAPEAIVASWFQRINKIDESEKWIRKAAGMYPKDPQVQLEFASWALNREDFATATDAVKKAEVTLLESTYSKNLKAKIAFAQEAFVIAESHYESLVSKQPMDSDLSNMYALTLVESKDQAKYDRALGIATRNLRALPNNRIAMASLAYIQMRGGDLDGARQLFNRAAQINGQSSEVDFFFAAYLSRIGNIAASKQFLDRAMSQKGLFLYRAAARRLQKELESKSLPVPNEKPKAESKDK